MTCTGSISVVVVISHGQFVIVGEIVSEEFKGNTENKTCLLQSVAQWKT